jgi:competence protein ComEC
VKKIISLSIVGIVLLCIFFIIDTITYRDNKLHVIFCNVGQGDAIFVRTPSGKNLLFDGGPDASVLDCLSRHMPFWDRTIDAMFLSHPHNDHYTGLIDVLERYSTKRFGTERLTNNTAGFKTLMATLDKQQIATQYLSAGDRFALTDGVLVTIMGPSKGYLHITSPHGKILETKEFASLINEISFGNFRVLLSGDSQASGIKDVVKRLSGAPIILQIPHHGSKTGLDIKTIRLLRPKLAVASVGKNNYGHPSRELLTIFSQEDIPVLRTDKHGDVEIVSDGKTWAVK